MDFFGKGRAMTHELTIHSVAGVTITKGSGKNYWCMYIDTMTKDGLKGRLTLFSPTDKPFLFALTVA